MDKQKVFDYIVIIISALIIIALLLFVVNQTLAFFYKSQFLQTPCGLCEKLNPGIEVVPKIILTNPNNLEIIEYNLSGKLPKFSDDSGTPN